MHTMVFTLSHFYHFDTTSITLLHPAKIVSKPYFPPSIRGNMVSSLNLACPVLMEMPV